MRLATAGRMLAGATAALALFASCQTSDPTSEPTKTPSPPSSEPTPSDDLPELSRTATEKTRKGAAAFAKHYYDLINYGRATNDWKPAKNVTLPTCKPCKDFWADKPSRMDNNRRIAHLRKPGVGRFDDPKTAVALRITTDADPNDIPMEPGHEWAELLWMDYENGRWMVEDLEFSDLWPKSSE